MKRSSGRSSSSEEPRKTGGEATGRVARIFRVAVRRLTARLPRYPTPERRESESRRRAHHKDDAPPKRYGERRRTVGAPTVVHGRDGWRAGFTIWWGERGVLMPPPPPRQQLQPHHPTAAADTVPDFYTRTRTRSAHTQQQTIAALFSFFISFFFRFSRTRRPSRSLPRIPPLDSLSLSLSVRFASRAHAWRVPFRLTRSPSPLRRPADRLRGTVRRRLVVLSLTLSRVYSRDIVCLSPSRDLFFLSLFFFFFFFYF